MSGKALWNPFHTLSWNKELEKEYSMTSDNTEQTPGENTEENKKNLARS